MPRVPTYQPGQVRQNPIAGVKNNNNATAKSFGLNEAKDMASFGESVERIGTSALRYEMQKQKEENDKKNKALVRDALNNARSETRQYMSEVYNRRGKDAVEVYGEVESTLQEIRRKHMGDFTDENQRDLFSSNYDSLMNGHLDRTTAFQAKSREDYEKLTLDAENKNAIEDAVATRYDEDALKEHEQTIVANTAYKFRGYEKEVKSKAIEDAVNNYHNQILSSFTSESPKKAQEYLDKHWDKFNPQVRDKIKKDIDKLVESEWVRDKSIELSSLPLDKQLEAVDQIKDVDKAAKVKKLVKERYQEKEDVKEVSRMERLEIEADKVRKDPFGYKLNVGNWDIKSQDYLASLQKTLKHDALAEKGVRSARKSDPKVYMELLETPKEKLKSEVLKKASSLSEADFKMFAKKATKDGYEEIQTVKSFVGKLQKELKLDEDESAFFASMFESELNKYPEADRKKAETHNKIKDQMLLEMDVKGSFFDDSYWKAKFKGKEMIEPDDKPEGLPENAKWVDKMVGEKIYRGWELVNPNGQTYLYVDGKPFLVRKKSKLANK